MNLTPFSPSPDVGKAFGRRDRLIPIGRVESGLIMPCDMTLVEKCDTSAMGHVFKSFPDELAARCMCGHVMRISQCVRCGSLFNQPRDKEELDKQHERVGREARDG